MIYIYDYFNWYCTNKDQNPDTGQLKSSFSDAQWTNFQNTYETHPAYGKKFHPFACFYGCEYVRNGVEFEFYM